MAVAPDDPAGPDLSYSKERAAIEQAFEQAAARSAEEIDWKPVIDTILAQSALTRDLWLAVYLARAGARSSRLDLVEQGCLLLAGLLERFWDTVHPKLEDYGVEGRKAPCESLVRIGEFLGPLRRTVLLEQGRHGRFSGEDFERFARDGEAADGYGAFRAALAATPDDHLQAVLDRLDQIGAALARADAVLSEQAAAANQTGTNFEPTYAVLDSIRSAVLPYVKLTSKQSEDSEETGDESRQQYPSEKGGNPHEIVVRAIRSREDVTKTLDCIIDYYARQEPASPIPIALARIKSWIVMDFMTLLRDIAPGGVSDADGVLRGRSDERRSADMM